MVGDSMETIKTFRKSTSKYMGVSWDSYNKKWRAQISFNKKVIYIGMFCSEVEAGEAYVKRLEELKEIYTVDKAVNGEM